MEDEIGDVAAAFSPSLINASEVYQEVKQAIVKISNGERTIGSGFILDAQAHVVTAHHVTENLPNIYVILSAITLQNNTRIKLTRRLLIS